MKRSPMPPRKTPLKTTTARMKHGKIKPRSAKMSEIYVERRKLVEELIGGPCQMRPGCTNRATCLHERWTRGRSGATGHAILCRANVIPSCAYCNSWVDDHTKEAEELGLLLPSSAGCPCGWKGKS